MCELPNIPIKFVEGLIDEGLNHDEPEQKFITVTHKSKKISNKKIYNKILPDKILCEISDSIPRKDYSKGTIMEGWRFVDNNPGTNLLLKSITENVSIHGSEILGKTFYAYDGCKYYYKVISDKDNITTLEQWLLHTERNSYTGLTFGNVRHVRYHF